MLGIFKDKSETEIKSESVTLNEEDKEFCLYNANLILGWTRCSSYSICSASNRMFACLNDNHQEVERKQLIRKYIAESEDQDLKNAALIHFDFLEGLREKDQTPDVFYKLLLTAMSDKKLTLEYANNLYRSCHNDTWYTQVPDENRFAVSKWLAPDLKSKAWQETIEQIRTIASGKLQEELRMLDDIAAQTALLERARTMPIFNEHTSNFRITGAFGQTRAVQWIDLQLNKLKQIQEPESPTLMFGI